MAGKTPRYFFFNGDLHQKLHINRGKDLMTAFNYAEGKVKKYSYTQIRRTASRAFSTREVGEMLNKTPKTIKLAISDGNFPVPQFVYNFENRERVVAFKWSEDDVLELHEYFTGVHRGRPRKDGAITPSGIPTRAELKAMLRNDTILYIKNNEGVYVPTWKAERI